MAKPLRSDDPNPRNVQFSHFGVLDTGPRSKGAAIFSISLNVAIAAAIIILGYAVKNNPVLKAKIDTMYLPPKPPPEPPKPKVPPPPPPKPLPKPPEIKIQPPKIKIPEPVKLPPEIKPVVVPTPKPVVLTPPAPKKVDPPPAPKVVNLAAKAAPAAIANNDAHPSAVRLGNPEIKALNSAAVATPVNLGGGMRGMPPGNTGSGPHSVSVNVGNGAPSGTNLNGKDRAPAKIAGLSTGVPGGTGTGRSGPVAVQIAPPAAAVPPPALGAVVHRQGSAPVVTYKPAPVYTEEAKAQHIEGAVQIRIKVTAAGQVIFLGITKGLGHGLDQSAQTVVNGMKFKPATDETGHPIDWTGDVLVRFQLS
jgi:TonB family protein